MHSTTTMISDILPIQSAGEVSKGVTKTLMSCRENDSGETVLTRKRSGVTSKKQSHLCICNIMCICMYIYTYIGGKNGNNIYIYIYQHCICIYIYTHIYSIYITYKVHILHVCIYI